MKKLTLYGLILGLAVMLSACFNNGGSDEDFNYQPGEIPGFGNDDGTLTGSAFNLPAGVTIFSDIAANGNCDGYWNFSEAKSYRSTNKDGSETERLILPKTTRSDSLCYRGSGSGLVDLIIPLHNSNSTPVTVTFPAALVVQNLAGECQNGVLLKKTTVVIPANSDYYVNLSFYCANLSKGTPGESDLYNFAVVSDADPILELCNMVKDKKINIEEFDPTSYDDQSTFTSQASMLQLIVWAVTDGTGLTNLYTMYINGLPKSK